VPSYKGVDGQARASDGHLTSFPIGSGVAVWGAVLMVVGACGPWISGHLLGNTAGLALGGDGWLVIAAAGIALFPLFLPLPRSGLRGAWVLTFAAVSAYVCWAHYQEAGLDGLNVVWGLELAAAGSALLALGGIRLLQSSR